MTSVDDGSAVQLSSLDPFTGEELWSEPAELDWADARVWSTTEDAVLVSDNGDNWVSLDPDTGEELAAFEAVHATPTTGPGTFYQTYSLTNSFDAADYEFTATDYSGERVWSEHSGGGEAVFMEGSLIVADWGNREVRRLG